MHKTHNSKKTAPLRLNKETLRTLGSGKLTRVAAAGTGGLSRCITTCPVGNHNLNLRKML